MSFRIWEAAIAAGASLDELVRLESGEYSGAFLAKLVAWYNMTNLITIHSEDAKNAALERRNKQRRR
jgi:hypothetical protein